MLISCITQDSISDKDNFVSIIHKSIRHAKTSCNYPQTSKRGEILEKKASDIAKHKSESRQLTCKAYMLTSCNAGCFMSSMNVEQLPAVGDSGLAYLLSTLTTPPINNGIRMLINATANAL